MLQLKCTRKLLKFIHATPSPFPVETTDTLLGAWHSNIVDIEEYRFLIFLNDKSLYCLVAALPATVEMIDLGLVFRQLLVRTLLRNGIAQTIIERIAKEYSGEIITKTDDRRVLGNITDIINQIYFFIEDSIDNNKPVDIQEMEVYLNEIPQRNIGWRFSKDVFRETLSAS
jgi:hypothetical protein